MKLHIFKTADETVKGLADFFEKIVNDTISRKGECTVVLSGGSSPKKLYELLTGSGYKSKIDWQKIWFLFGDERYVPFSDDDNNGKMAKKTLFGPLKIEESKIFYINTFFSPPDAANDYGEKIKNHLDKHSGHFDLVLLGIGENAHTASLFPGTAVIHESKALVEALYIDELKAYRITMTPIALNNSTQIAFLVYGENKAEAVYNIMKAPRNIDQYPAQVINEQTGKVSWFLDAAAASKLDHTFITELS